MVPKSEYSVNRSFLSSEKYDKTYEVFNAEQ